jgi:hypothetical protein
MRGVLIQIEPYAEQTFTRRSIQKTGFLSAECTRFCDLSIDDGDVLQDLFVSCFCQPRSRQPFFFEQQFGLTDEGLHLTTCGVV